MYRPLDTQGVSAPLSGSMEFPFFENINFPNWQSNRLLFGSSQRLPSGPVNKAAIGPQDSSISNAVPVNGGPASITYVPQQYHQPISISDVHSSNNFLHGVEHAPGLNTPKSVSRFVQLSNGQVAVLQAGPTRYDQVLLPNGQVAPLQVGPTSNLNCHSGDRARLCTPLLFPPQIALYEYHNGGQALSSVSKGEENSQLNSTKSQLPKELMFEQNSRPQEGYLGNVSGPEYSRSISAPEICRVRQFFLQFQHASNCLFQSGECEVPFCKNSKLLFEHIQNCGNKQCRCLRVKRWISHFYRCAGCCFICLPVYAASLKSNVHSTENVRGNTKRTLSNLYANNSDVLNPPSKCSKMAQLDQVTGRCVGNVTESIVVDKEACVTPSEETFEIFRENFGPTVSIEKGSSIQSTNLEMNNVQHRHQGTKLCLDITAPSFAQMSQGASLSCPFTSQQASELNLRRNQYTNQMEVNAIVDVIFATERNPLSYTNRVDHLKPSLKCCKTDDHNRECQVTSKLFNNALGHSGDLPEETNKKDCENWGSGLVATKEGAGAEPLVEGKISVNCEKEVEKLLPKTTLSYGTYISNDTSFLYQVTLDQVMKNSLSHNHWGVQSKEMEDMYQGPQGSMDGNLDKLMIDNIPSETARKEMFIEEKTSAQSMQKVESQVHAKVDIFEVVVDPDISMPSATHLNQKILRGNDNSLICSFTSEQVREHLLSLKQWSDQFKATEKAGQRIDGSMAENCCSLCGLGELSFEMLPKSCSNCQKPLREDSKCYRKPNVDLTDDGGGNFIYYCKRCQKKDKLNGLEKVKNSGTNEHWVECDKCNIWQHQICALFNNQRNESDQVEYTCAHCYLSKISADQKLMAHSEILEAKHLPRTKLSDHIEQWLSWRLEEDKQKRAAKLGKNINEVPAAEDLVVREVSSVNLKVKVMDSLREMLLKDDYPKEFPCKSKAIVLFQKIEGADVCLFAIYTQEYGSECPYPNRGRIYLSYIDSVKYFRPDIRAANERRLRTYVYHEILIGYLDYCKKRGFNSFHLWACPSQRKVDYIMYCHPKDQKVITRALLRNWYQDLIHKAEEENIVVGSTTFYDKYFTTNGGNRKINVVPEKLPYFAGDFWPIKVEQILRDNESAMKEKEKEFVSNSTMKELGTHIIRNCWRNDFIIIQLQHDYEHYEEFPLHRKDHETTESFNMEDMKPTNKDAVRVEENITKALDEDENISSRIFNKRTDFLEFCQKNNYQFNTLRQAKHSTMMIIHQLHKEASEDNLSSEPNQKGERELIVAIPQDKDK